MRERKKERESLQTERHLRRYLVVEIEICTISKRDTEIEMLRI